MNEFDLKAAEWDNNPMHIERSKAIASGIKARIPLNKNMTALEFGAGTGTTSLFLADSLKEITMMDNSHGMVSVMTEKIRSAPLKNLKVVEFDLDKDEYIKEHFDLVFNQMVLHHVSDVNSIIGKFKKLLNPGGYLAIADLYKEDGSFHGEGSHVHKGFDPEELGKLIKINGFTNINHSKCFTIGKQTDSGFRDFDVFLLTCHLPVNID
jgi:ubiquinone/menaquinone biosynthesis C-methylase UbiE